MIRAVTETILPRIQTFLEKYGETSLFLLSNLTNLGYRLTDDLNSGNYKDSEADEEVDAVFCLTRRGNCWLKQEVARILQRTFFALRKRANHRSRWSWRGNNSECHLKTSLRKPVI